jgi:hypothetical protein
MRPNEASPEVGRIVMPGCITNQHNAGCGWLIPSCGREAADSRIQGFTAVKKWFSIGTANPASST